MLLLEKAISLVRGLIVTIRLRLNSNSNAGKKLRVGRNCRIRIRKNSGITIGDNVVIGDGVKISSLNGGNIIIGDDVGIGDYDQIVSHDQIEIQTGCNIAPFVSMYDHDHVVELSGVVRNRFMTKPIQVGKRTWIGANTIVLKGSVIGDNCVIAAGSIVLDNIVSNTKFVQKRTASKTPISK